MTVSIDPWHAGIGLFYGKVYVSVKVFNTDICLSSVCQLILTCLTLIYFFFCFYCITEMLNDVLTLLTLSIFHTLFYSSASTVNFEQIVAGWVTIQLDAFLQQKIVSIEFEYNQKFFKVSVFCLQKTHTLHYTIIEKRSKLSLKIEINVQYFN